MDESSRRITPEYAADIAARTAQLPSRIRHSYGRAYSANAFALLASIGLLLVAFRLSDWVLGLLTGVVLGGAALLLYLTRRSVRRRGGIPRLRYWEEPV